MWPCPWGLSPGCSRPASGDCQGSKREFSSLGGANHLLPSPREAGHGVWMVPRLQEDDGTLLANLPPPSPPLGAHLWLSKGYSCNHTRSNASPCSAQASPWRKERRLEAETPTSGSVCTLTLLLWIWRAPLAWGGMPCSNWSPGAPCRAERCRPLSRDPHPSGSSILPGGQPRAWSVPRRLPVSAAGPVLAPQRYLYPLLQIGSEQSLICQHRLPTLRCHQPPLLPRSVTCLSEM